MSNKQNSKDSKVSNVPKNEELIPRKGNYKALITYQKAEAIYDMTYYFCKNYLRRGDRTVDQMVQAARSGARNISEGGGEMRRRTAGKGPNAGKPFWGCSRYPACRGTLELETGHEG